MLCAAAVAACPVGLAHADRSSSGAHPLQSARIDSGSSHTCVISGNGDLHCWGFGGKGVLGQGDTEDIGDDETPASVGPVALGSGRTAVESTGGEAHHCAILDNGSVRCWGFGKYGRLGYGNTNDIGDDESPAAVGPVNLGSGRTAVSISAGEAHTCAILDNGTVKCWGWATYGTLGYGNTNEIGDDETPAAVGAVNIGSGRTAVAITAGVAHTCALLDNGTVRCWGANFYGQLGTGTGNIGDDETPGSIPPVNLGSGRTAVAISAGWNHTCAILDNGTVKCWGDGEDGRLGYGNENDVATPSSVGAVNLGPGRTAVAISATETHTCAVLDNGTVRCWGENAYGQLGYGNSTKIGDDETPGSVAALDLGTGRRAVAVVAGRYFSCATLDNGGVRCWGEGAYGLLGYGNTTRIGDDEPPGAAGPVELGDGHGALETVAGTSHTCALFDTGGVRCWGKGANGRLGYAATDTIGDDESPGSVGPVDLGGHSAAQIAAGDAHTCALLDNGTVSCWGNGGGGRLGYANTNDIGDDETPDTAGPVDLDGHTAISLDAGGAHTCAVLNDGTVRCWGLGASGQLGYSNTIAIGDDETPGTVGPVALGGSALKVSTGANHTCARLVDGSTRCWGLGASGQLGHASPESIGDDETPAAAGSVSVGGSALRVPAGGNHSCALQSNGAVRCWGKNASGQLGYAGTANYGDGAGELPSSIATVLLGEGRNALALAPGASHNCALIANGTVRCWGLNGDGQLGYANTDSIGDDETPAAAGPVDLGSGLNATQLSAGGAHTCSVRAEGSVLCWGLNADGQLGRGDTTTIGDDETPGSTDPVDFEDDPPVAVDDEATVEEDFGTPIEVLANDTDVDGGPMEIVAKTNGEHGTVAIIGPGSAVAYIPDSNYCGPDSFTYELNGGSEATVSVTIACVDDPPSAVDDEATLEEDAGATAIGVLGNDTDIDGGPKEVIAKTDGAHGTVAITGGGTGLTYEPDADYCGPDSFTYELNGGSEATVSVTITCVDDLPVAVDDEATLEEDAGATAIDVLANDTDVDGATPKEVLAKTDGAHGTVAITGGGSGLTYTPDADYCGPDSFTYELNGGSEATVSVTITCVDDLPVAVDDEATVAEDSGATAIGVLGNDTDPDGGAKTIEAKTDGAHGSVSITGGSTGLTYAPDAGYCGPDSFTYELNGGSEATVSITVTCVDDLPSAANDSATVAEDSGANAIPVLANDTDPDGGAKLVESKTDGAHGTVAITGGGSGLTYTPDANYCGADAFTYELNGGSQASVSVTVTCVDDTPVAVDDSDTVIEDAPATAIDVLANDTDIDGGLKTIAGKTNGSHGTATIIGAGAGIAYAPAPDYCGPDSFTYFLNGGSSATVSITVTCVEDQAPATPTTNPPPSTGGTSTEGRERSSSTVVNVTPGVGVLSGRRRPRVAVKGYFAFFTLTCRLTDSDCRGKVFVKARLPSIALGKTVKFTVTKGRFRIGARRSVLVRARLTRRARRMLGKRSLRGVSSKMAVVDTLNGEKGAIAVTLVRRPRASLLPGNHKKHQQHHRKPKR